MKKIIPTYNDFLNEDAATMTDDMSKLLQDVNNAAKKRLKSIDKNLGTTGFTHAPGKGSSSDTYITLNVQNNSYLGTGNYAVADLKKGVRISQSDWNQWSDEKIYKYVQQWINSLKTGQE